MCEIREYFTRSTCNFGCNCAISGVRKLVLKFWGTVLQYSTISVNVTNAMSTLVAYILCHVTEC